MIRRTLAIVSALGLASCSLAALDGLSDGVAGPDAGTESGTASNDGGRGVDASDAATTSDGDGGSDPGGLYVDTFESSALCTPWVASRTVASTSDTSAKLGSRSCYSCTNTTGGGGIERDYRPQSPATTMPPGEYTFTVWVRDDAYAGSIAFELYELNQAGDRGTYRRTQLSVLGTAWNALQIIEPVAAPVYGFHVELWVDEPPPVGTCFFADEASVVYAP
jgi:hypothetical protein